jgi:heat shock protein HslJ
MTIRRLGALAALLLLVAGCTAAGGTTDQTADGNGGELGATRWVLQSYASAGVLTIVPEGQFADAEFVTQRVKGFSGCNDYDAVYRAASRLLLVGRPAVTLMACPEPEATFETAYLTLLQQSRFYNIRSDQLTIRGADLAVLLVFRAAPANPLLGSWVVDSFESAPSTVSAVLPGTELTTVFSFDKVAGFAGCNSYTGPYTTNGSVAAIGPLATTRMACAEDVMAQETAFLAAMQGVARVESRGQTLQLQDRNGHLVVALTRPVTPEPSASPSAAPSATTAPTATQAPTATPGPTATPAPTVTPTAAPTGTPAPTATPAPTGTPAPTVKPPASLPTLATCTVVEPTSGTTIATISYPSSWHTTTAPPSIACRYFDPNPITVPADPSTLTTAVMIKADLTAAYADALAAATNPTAWNVLVNQPATVGGLPATRIEATATAGSDGVAVGQTRYGYLINAGGHPVWIETVGTVGDATFQTNMSVVDLIASQAKILAAAPS